jgi:hypothetical protein
MRSRVTAILCLVGSLMLVWAGCSGERTGGKFSTSNIPSPVLAKHTGEPCVHDADCPSGFCDRVTCGDWSAFYGSPCAPPAPDARPVDKLPERLCHGYLCLDGRCRSCQSDAECQSYYGMGKCTVTTTAGGQEAALCYPETTRLPELFTCTKDAQCQSLFCDRGSCAGIGVLAVKNYGEDCVPGPPKAPPEDLRVAPPGGGMCEGYVCVDRRCRSCQSDAECQEGSRDLQCLHFPFWPGAICVTPAQAEIPPRYIVPSVAPGAHPGAGPARGVPVVPPARRSPFGRPSR